MKNEKYLFAGAQRAAENGEALGGERVS